VFVLSPVLYIYKKIIFSPVFFLSLDYILILVTYITNIIFKYYIL